jgi:hypothetical protein
MSEYEVILWDIFSHENKEEIAFQRKIWKKPTKTNLINLRVKMFKT